MYPSAIRGPAASLEALVVDDAVDDPEPLGLLGGEPLGEKVELPGPRRADEPREEPGTAVVTGEADAREGGREYGATRGDPQVTREGKREPRAGRGAGRHLERRGEGGYMLIFQLDDLAGARERARALGVRTVWSIDIDNISASHLHPADLGGTIVSIDRPLPPESWRWGGPDWIGHAGRGAPGRLAGVTVRVPDPAAIAARWAEVLGLEPDGTTLRLDRGQRVAFEPGNEGLAEIAVERPGGAADPLEFGAARVVPAHS